MTNCAWYLPYSGGRIGNLGIDLDVHLQDHNRIWPMTLISATKPSSSVSTAPPVDQQDFRNVQAMLRGRQAAAFVRPDPAVGQGQHLPLGTRANGLPQGRFGPSSFGAVRALAGGQHRPQLPVGLMAAAGRHHSSKPSHPNHPNRLQIAGSRFLHDLRHASVSRMLRHPLSAAADFAVKFVSRLLRPSKA